MQQLVTFFQLELHGRRVPEDRVRVDARAVDVEDVLDGVAHVIKGLSGSVKGSVEDFSDDVRAYLQNFPLNGLYREIQIIVGNIYRAMNFN